MPWQTCRSRWRCASCITTARKSRATSVASDDDAPAVALDEPHRQALCTQRVVGGFGHDRHGLLVVAPPLLELLDLRHVVARRVRDAPRELALLVHERERAA